MNHCEFLVSLKYNDRQLTNMPTSEDQHAVTFSHGSIWLAKSAVVFIMIFEHPLGVAPKC
jgi:hypothetical protein